MWFFAAGEVNAIPESSCVQPKRHVTAINYEVARLLHRTYRRSLRDTTTIDQAQRMLVQLVRKLQYSAYILIRWVSSDQYQASSSRY